MGIAKSCRLALVACCAATAIAADEPLAERDWPGGDRAAIEIPADAWERVLAGTVPTRRPLGFTGDEMRNYGGREHLLRTVENLFRDVRAIQRDTGRITDDLLQLAAEGKIDEVLQRCWALTDLPSGRMYEAPKGDDWGVPDVPKGASCAEAMKALVPRSSSLYDPERNTTTVTTPDAHTRFLELPEPVRRFVLRLIVAHRVAEKWLANEGPSAAHTRSVPLFPRVVAPWTEESESQTATSAWLGFQLLDRVDRASIAYGSVIFLAHLTNAVSEIRPWLDGPGREALGNVPASGVQFGPVAVFGPGVDVHDKLTAPIVIDFGGNDTWAGRNGCSTGGERPLSVVIDLGGDDTYVGGDEAYALGCGAFGLGAVVDLSGDDTYTVESDGLGRGLFGTGLLWDLAGNDSYVVKTKWGQGAAHAGVGVLLDVSGDDRYECAEQSQGMGSTLGCGLLLDLAGNDEYVCRDDGNVSELYLGQSVAMAQGCGYGRRADIGDGRSLAGGWGLLVDGAGNDRYHAQCWSQGCGYWWGVGVLEDRGGDDVYENGKYSLGAGAHFAIGVQVDLAGDDRYNVGVATTKNQFQGHARDGSVGISIDGDGNDRYALKNMCAGCADLASVALFWDRRGDDVYEATMDPTLGDTGPFGTATTYPPHRSFRDDLPAVGVFLDTGGKDTYAGDPRAAGGARDGAAWRERRGPASFGFALDAALFR